MKNLVKIKRIFLALLLLQTLSTPPHLFSPENAGFSSDPLPVNPSAPAAQTSTSAPSQGVARGGRGGAKIGTTTPITINVTPTNSSTVNTGGATSNPTTTVTATGQAGSGSLQGSANTVNSNTNTSSKPKVNYIEAEIKSIVQSTNLFKSDSDKVDHDTLTSLYQAATKGGTEDFNAGNLTSDDIKKLNSIMASAYSRLAETAQVVEKKSPWDEKRVTKDFFAMFYDMDTNNPTTHFAWSDFLLVFGTAVGLGVIIFKFYNAAKAETIGDHQKALFGFRDDLGKKLKDLVSLIRDQNKTPPQEIFHLYGYLKKMALPGSDWNPSISKKANAENLGLLFETCMRIREALNSLSDPFANEETLKELKVMADSFLDDYGPTTGLDYARKGGYIGMISFGKWAEVVFWTSCQGDYDRGLHRAPNKNRFSNKNEILDDYEAIIEGNAHVKKKPDPKYEYYARKTRQTIRLETNGDKDEPAELEAAVKRLYPASENLSDEKFAKLAQMILTYMGNRDDGIENVHQWADDENLVDELNERLKLPRYFKEMFDQPDYTSPFGSPYASPYARRYGGQRLNLRQGIYDDEFDSPEMPSQQRLPQRERYHRSPLPGVLQQGIPASYLPAIQIINKVEGGNAQAASGNDAKQNITASDKNETAAKDDVKLPEVKTNPTPTRRTIARSKIKSILPGLPSQRTKQTSSVEVPPIPPSTPLPPIKKLPSRQKTAP